MCCAAQEKVSFCDDVSDFEFLIMKSHKSSPKSTTTTTW
jgi:hypothetical protein